MGLYTPPTAADVSNNTAAAQNAWPPYKFAPMYAPLANAAVSVAAQSPWLAGMVDRPAVQPAATPAQDAAKAAAAKPATQGETGGFPDMMPNQRASDANDKSTTDWNTHVAQVLGAAGNVGSQADVARMMAGPQPGWTKQAGMDAMDVKGGAPRILNYGYGSTIIGSGSAANARRDGTGLGRANSFTGVGMGAAPAGAAGVFGPPPGGPPSPLETARAHVNDLYAQAAQLSKSGTLWGKIQAAGLYKRATAMMTGVMGEGQTEHAQGSLQLARETAYPTNMINHAALTATLGGDTNALARIEAAKQGQNYDAPHYQMFPMGARQWSNANPNQTNVFDYAGMPALTPLPGQR